MGAEIDIWRLAAGLGLFLTALIQSGSASVMITLSALHAVASSSSTSHRFEILVELKRLNEEIHLQLHGYINKDVAVDRLSDVQISALLNVNRELYLANQSQLASLSEALLDIHGVEDFESIPTGTRNVRRRPGDGPAPGAHGQVLEIWPDIGECLYILRTVSGGGLVRELRVDHCNGKKCCNHPGRTPPGPP